MKNKKKTCITIVVCLVVGIISGIAYFQVGKAAKKDNSQVVNESTTTKKDKGKTGKSLLNEINIKSYKDISKIVVGENSQEDVSWVEPIQTITFTNKDDIDYLYNQLSKLKTLNKNGADDENEVEANVREMLQRPKNFIENRGEMLQRSDISKKFTADSRKWSSAESYYTIF